MPSTDPNRGADSLAGFDGLYGLQIDEAGPDEMRGHVVVQDHHKQPAGLVHGGIYAAMGESMASIGTWLGVGPEKSVAGMTNTTTFVRPILDGTIHAVGRPRHTGRTTWVWELDFTDDQERLCALVRVTIAIVQPR